MLVLWHKRGHQGSSWGLRPNPDPFNLCKWSLEAAFSGINVGTSIVLDQGFLCIVLSPMERQEGSYKLLTDRPLIFAV